MGGASHVLEGGAARPRAGEPPLIVESGGVDDRHVQQATDLAWRQLADSELPGRTDCRSKGPLGHPDERPLDDLCDLAHGDSACAGDVDRTGMGVRHRLGGETRNVIGVDELLTTVRVGNR